MKKLFILFIFIIGSHLLSAQQKSINLDIETLFGGDIETVVVSEQKDEVSFRDKERGKYYYSQAQELIANRSYESAIVMLSKSLKKEKNKKELLQLRANAYTETGKFGKAKKDYKKALRVAPDDAVLNYNYASNLVKLGKYKESIKYYTKAVENKENYLLAYQGRAAANTMSKRYKDAINDYNQVIDINSFFIAAYKGRGIARSLLSEYDRAITDFSFYIESEPTDAQAFYFRGLAHSSLDEMGRACNDFNKAATLGSYAARIELKKVCGVGTNFR